MGQKEESSIYWVGPRESDIVDTNDLYSGSVTFLGTNSNNNLSYSFYSNCRINHNVFNQQAYKFVENRLNNILASEKNARFMFYNPYYAFSFSSDIIEKSICLNDYSLQSLLRNKLKSKFIFSRLTPTLESKLFIGQECKIENLKKYFPNSEHFVIQSNIASGGFGTNLLNENLEQTFSSKITPYDTYIVSPYFRNSIPVNVHINICRDDIEYFPGSIQIIDEQDGLLLYKGADFITFQSLNESIRSKISLYAKSIANYLQAIGYLGVCGIDFLIINNEAFFLEVNSRFQSSTFLLNKALKENGQRTINHKCIDSFLNKSIEPAKNFSIKYSHYNFLFEENEKQIEHLLKCENQDYVEIQKDGYSSNNIKEKNSHLFKIIFPTNITSINPENRISIHENISNHEIQVKSGDYLQLKIRLLNQGVSFTEKAINYYQKNGGIQTGVFSSVDIKIDGLFIVNSPVNIKFSNLSPFTIDIIENEASLLCYDVKICKVSLSYSDLISSYKTKNKIPFGRIAKLVTDRLRISHRPLCFYKEIKVGCEFCNLPYTAIDYSLEDIKEVFDVYLEKCSFDHIMIGGGADDPNRNLDKILSIISYIRKKSDLKIYLMILPIADEQILSKLYQAGVDEIGFNIEIFDRKLAQKIMPGKGKITRERYFEAYKAAVKIWGKRGNVRSLVILGLEKSETLLNGVQNLCEIGVMPIISIFRPLPNTTFKNLIPPDYDYVYNNFLKIVNITSKYGLIPGPSCERCQNNTLSLPVHLFSSLK